MSERVYGNDSSAWRLQVVIAFAVALLLTTGGIVFMSTALWEKGYLIIGLYFTVSSAFNLAKTLRDEHESDQLSARISQAKTEKILREYGEVSS